MELLVARNLTLDRHGLTLARSLDLTLRTGQRLGLVGANGSGKSTLLRLLARRERPDQGRVRPAPGARIGYLEQDPGWDEGQTVWEAALAAIREAGRLERELREEEGRLALGSGSLERYAELHDEFERAGGYAAEALLRETLVSLGLAEELFSQPLSRLSGGERSRLALARVLATEPEILLLDEPSNHLDLPALQWLGERLRRHRGALVLVSHDRALLDEVCTETAELRAGELTFARGGVSRLREQQGVRRRSSERELRERRKENERLERTAAELRAWGTAKAQRRRKRLERDIDRSQPARPGPTPALPVPAAREASGILLHAHGLSKALGARQVLSRAEVRIRAGDKIALLGPNGSGKSTLLRLLTGELASDDPRCEFRWHRDAKLFHAGQEERGLVPGEPLLDQMTRFVSRERAHMLLALTGLGEGQRESPPEGLSGGERARAGLARLLAAEANLLLLDEPTNDLDLAAIETLHHALQTTEAAWVVATHDRALAALAERVWAIEEGELVEYRGGVNGYLAGRRRLEPELVDASVLEVERETARERAADWGEGGSELPPDGGPELPGDAPFRIERLELERLELERLGVEARLEDPLSLSERERDRLERHLATIMNELSLRYDRSLPTPRPAFSVRECGLRLYADLTFAPEGAHAQTSEAADPRVTFAPAMAHAQTGESADAHVVPGPVPALGAGAEHKGAAAVDGLAFSSDAPVSLRLLLRDGVGHLTVSEPDDACLLPWARAALLDGATRLAFYVLAPDAVQVYWRGGLACRLLRNLGGGWWSLSRRSFERLEGWRPRKPSPAVGGPE
jgi:ATP-binding cassette subfamily F protein 3